MSSEKKEVSQTTGPLNAETNEPASETKVITCSCCGKEIEPLKERVCFPLIDAEADHPPTLREKTVEVRLMFRTSPIVVGFPVHVRFICAGA